MTRTSTGRIVRRALALLVIFAPALLLGLEAAAQENDPIAEHLFPPDLVMQHQREIALTPAQRETLIEELQQTQADMVPLQFEVKEASEVLANLLSANRVDEGQVLAQAKRVMELETRARARHLTLLVRIKNLLSPKQQEDLHGIRGGGPK